MKKKRNYDIFMSFACDEEGRKKLGRMAAMASLREDKIVTMSEVIRRLVMNVKEESCQVK